jgi:hypothetical protein
MLYYKTNIIKSTYLRFEPLKFMDNVYFLLKYMEKLFFQILP